MLANKSRRSLLLGAGSALFLSGCDRLSQTEWFPKVLRTHETLSRGVHKLLGSRPSMAQEFTEADISPFFRSNGTSMPEGAEYQALAKNGFADWQLEVGGLVEKPVRLSIAELRAMPRRTQITRHDCVEGWSAIGKWTGVPLSNVLAMVKPQPAARYVVFHCADAMGGSLTPEFYYESIDLDDAMHPQTILAYGLNGKDLPIANGAPVRLRVERQLGYKHAKYVKRIELVESFANIAGGKGGYWEDNGYQWYAGI
ncbi:MAG: molybdopterin-dependent oxidoreductase [Burkholderiaceae bacterium]|nr:molybdopterin-dependent oxidoreductase [Burkholderiaceae bacterium]